MYDNIVKKKRGRKPKNNNLIINTQEPKLIENINSEDENIIYHLPLTVNSINSNNLINNNSNIFLINDEFKANVENSETIDNIDNNINQSSINKIITHKLNLNENIKCWWCKNNFTSTPIQLPENYFNNNFYCIGHFCSFNCLRSYNLDLNDCLTYKRDSLIYLLYFLSFNFYSTIKQAPHWITLKEFGGVLTIDEFRNNFTNLNSDFLLLNPPLISRQLQIEESYKINKIREVNINKVNKIYSDIDSDYILKRNKSVHSLQQNLESSMGLIKMKR